MAALCYPPSLQMDTRLKIFRFEAKPRNLSSGVHYHTDEQEPYSDSIFGQEVAEPLGQAFACSNGADGKWNDHDGWLITLHGSKLRVLHAYFSQSYLLQVNSPVLPLEQRLPVWCSPQFNLKYPNEWDQALRMVMGLICPRPCPSPPTRSSSSSPFLPFMTHCFVFLHRLFIVLLFDFA
ncbi:uncharacterized protein ASPGLDRAFT_936868 [Aspergillus glaucus CBS 516.65]|uniref:Uncharacterized protein n=1 Tax=Aspergillus glaucus CBS 516.65 TaxID=1160497 RepID=A0A1L9V7A6_ASPGL|nr:hypothetical protein ASPGLDRAFT_936868 [Aspergillus glaucus CBS 516.65]OJJ79742.1 hypothetical protein ASPGLDRAFT_936868 [Aspergillus glaucus CBS 516.65]